MSSPQARESDSGLLLAVLALLAVALTLGYAPWVLASIPLATIVVLITGLTRARPGPIARRLAGVFVLALIPAGLDAYAY